MRFEDEERLTAALRRRPVVTIPVGFAARVAAEAGGLKRAVSVVAPPVRAQRFGPMALYAGLVLLVGAMVVVARFAGAGAALAAECGLAAEMVGLAVCLGLAPGMLR